MAGFDEAAALPTLWTDSPDATSRLQQSRASKEVSGQDYADLKHFIEHGWVVWRKAIPAKLIDKFVRDIREIHHHQGMFLRSNHRHGDSRLHLTGKEPDAYESLYDLYVNLDSARRVCMHPRIVNFLKLVFRERPVAMQQLLFQRSNGHRVHQDTAYVAVEEPMKLAASWIALQDVVEGSGELAWFDRSHRLPHYLFADGTKRFNPSADNEPEYIAALESACRERGLEYHRFMARKGDVFIWAADLVHRSHPRTLPEDTPRLSCVTHYYPESTQPFWFRFHEETREREAYKEADAFFVSSHYKLPSNGQMITPLLTK